jgi:hypothetical protein
VQAAYVSGSGTHTLVFSYAIQGGQNDDDGIAIPAGQILLNGGSIRDAAGNDAALGIAGAADNGSYKVDTAHPAAGTLQVTGFADAGISASDGLSNDRDFTLAVAGHEAGASIGFIRSFNGATNWVGEGPAQSNVPVGPNYYLGVVTDAAGNDSYTPAFYVNIDATAPAVQTVALTEYSSQAAGQPLQAGDIVSTRIKFTEAVHYVPGAGAMVLGLTVGAQAVDAAYASGSGSDELLFTYTVPSNLPVPASASARASCGWKAAPR